MTLCLPIFTRVRNHTRNNDMFNLKKTCNMKTHVEKIKSLFEAFVTDADKCPGNKAAGARARKAALELMKDLKEFRKLSVEADRGKK